MPIGLIGGLISGGGSLLSGLLGSNSQTEAAKIQAQAANQASQIQLQEFQQLQQNLQPYMQSGVRGVGALDSATLGGGFGPLGNLLTTAQGAFGNAPQYQPLTAQSFQSSPGYQFQLGEGMNTIQNSAAGKSGAVSGNMLKALQTYGTGLANQDWYQANNLNLSNYLNQQYNPYLTNANLFNQGNLQGFNMLNTLAGSGQSAAAGLGTAGIQTGLNVGNNIIGAGNAQAAGTIGSANALAGGFNGLSTALLGNQIGGNSGGGSGGLLAQLLGLGGGNSIGGTIPGSSPLSSAVLAGDF